MSRMSELMYHPLKDVEDTLLSGENITLDETQAALINAIHVIRDLQARVELIENRKF